MSRMTRGSIPRLSALGLACLMLATSSGCQMGRKWFQMDSNSSTPYFGLELTPRSTSLVVPSQASPGTPRVDGKAVAELSGSRSGAGGGIPIQLPRINLRADRERQEDVSLTGPQSAFSR